MKTILLYFIAISFGCRCSKIATTTKKNMIQNVSKATINNADTDSLITLPPCIKSLIQKMKTEGITNPPSKIYSYRFNNKTVYYVPPVCCDNFSDLYDDSCKIIAHPDGGFTGRGDGKIPNFKNEKTNEKLIWEDKRK